MDDRAFPLEAPSFAKDELTGKKEERSLKSD
jgi:hypothetical protein